MREGGVRIRADVQRHALAKQRRTTEKYTSEMSDQVYGRLQELTTVALAARFPVIADATFLKAPRRQMFEELAQKCEVPFEIIDCDAPYEELCQRIQTRQQDPSEATTEVLDLQLKTCDPLTESERALIRSR
jgi:predicted kinase